MPTCPTILRALLPPAFAVACGGTSYGGSQEPTPQAYYQTAPAHDASLDLDRVFDSVQRIEFSADYVTYLFSERSGVTEADVRARRFQSRADTSYAETLTKSGTATIIARSGSRLTLLSVNHVVQFPAMRLDYYGDGPGRRTSPGDTLRRVAAASIRTDEQGLLLPRGGPLPFEVLARDPQHDLSLLRLDLPRDADVRQYPVLELGAGSARRLSWGSFVYVVGFPRGYPMVTRAIVSNPDWDGQGSFITDGIWNEGMSGGLVLAVRSEDRHLELVGLARASAAEREFRLRPDTTGVAPGAPATRYEGPLYLETGLRPQYGIALPVSMTTIAEFLRRQGVSLRGRD